MSEKKVEITVIREDDDPGCPRSSLGGTPEIGYYLVFRGDHKKIRDLLIRCLGALTYAGKDLQVGERATGEVDIDRANIVINGEKV